MGESAWRRRGSTWSTASRTSRSTPRLSWWSGGRTTCYSATSTSEPATTTRETARLYEDFGLFTGDPDIAADIAELFNFLTGFSKPSRFRKILVAPFALRNAMKEQIRIVAKAAGDGQAARIRMKLNALTDPELIEELYRASQAGVKIRILCRGICCLVPGVAGMSENITVRSVLGRFLEHSRVYIFEAGDRTNIFFGSADFMQRNLDQRIEVVVPALDPKVQQELSTIHDIGWDDKAFVWQLSSDGSWIRIGEQGKRKLGLSSQDMLMRRAQGSCGAQEVKAEQTPPLSGLLGLGRCQVTGGSVGSVLLLQNPHPALLVQDPGAEDLLDDIAVGARDRQLAGQRVQQPDDLLA